MMKKFCMVGICLIFTGLVYGKEILSNSPLPFLAEGKKGKVEVWINPWKPNRPKKTCKKPFLVLEFRGKWAKVLFQNSSPFWIHQRKIRISKSQKKGVVLSKTDVFHKKEGKKIGTLEKGDFLTLLKKEGPWFFCKSQRFYSYGYVLRKNFIKSQKSLPKCLEGFMILYKKKHLLSPLEKRIFALQKRFQKELDKDVDQMDLKPIILECIALEKEVKKAKLARWVRELKAKVIHSDKIRKEYLRLTAPMREKIDKMR